MAMGMATVPLSTTASYSATETGPGAVHAIKEV
jgi:hypothetical protein